MRLKYSILWFEDKPKIRFGIYKTNKLIDNGLKFLDEIKSMLYKFRIDSTNTWIIKGNTKELTESILM